MAPSHFRTVTVGALLILIVLGVALAWQRAASPTEASGDIVQVASGNFHSCALSSGGGIQCWGANWYGQLGDGTTADRSTPVDVVGLGSGVSAIAAGGSHTCAITTAGALKCWGYDVIGQIGNSEVCSEYRCTTPVNVVGLGSGVAAVSGGSQHTCALTTGGALKCWGDNREGQLGTGSSSGPEQCPFPPISSFACSNTPANVVGLGSGVTAVAAGGAHTCALTTGGGVKCWGRGSSGQLGNGSTGQQDSPVVVNGLGSGVAALGAGTFHSCAVTTAGGVKCWGDDEYGELGATTTETCDFGEGVEDCSTTPLSVATLSSGVTAVDGGGQHTCALTTGGGLKCWGRNATGQVGDGTTTDQHAPVNVVGLSSGVDAVVPGDSHTCALTTGGGLKCWGSNGAGQLAILPPVGPETCGDGGSCSRTPVDVTKASPATPTPTPCPAECPTPTNTPLPPAFYLVNDNVDLPDANAGDGVCATSASTCTLRAAIQEVNASPGPDVIVPPGIFFLTAGPLIITADLTLNGAGAFATVVDGGKLGRVLEITAGATVEISAVRVRNGLHTIGGGISNEGDLILTEVTIEANSATLRGGGIVNEGGNLTLNNSVVRGNSAGVTGGGIRNVGTMTINESEISDNSAGASSGGITNRYGGSVLTINDSLISGNSSVHSAGISNQLDSVVTVNNTTVSGNSASYQLGGDAIGNNVGGTVIINDSAITGNTGIVTSGIGNSGSMTINNSTISGNGFRGIDNAESGVLAINNSTITDNGSYGVDNSTNAVTLKNTIVANNGGDDCLEPVTSAGYNLDSDGTCGLVGTGDISSADPLLGPLAGNGGPTLTHALLSSSPAIDAGSTDCPPPAIDQRGAARPFDGDGDGTATCDIGAFELCPASDCPLPTTQPTLVPPTPTDTRTPTSTPTPTFTPTPTPTFDPTDTDNDGCTDQRENGPDKMLGGMRDWQNPNDYYDVNGDRIIDLPNDVLGVIQHYAPSGTEPTYDVNFDRGPSTGPNAWNMTAPDGVIDLSNDILGVVQQFGHSCQ